MESRIATPSIFFVDKRTYSKFNLPNGRQAWYRLLFNSTVPPTSKRWAWRQWSETQGTFRQELQAQILWSSLTRVNLIYAAVCG